MKSKELKSLLNPFRITIVTALLLFICNAGFLFSGEQNPCFQAMGSFLTYDRDLILNGQIWRLITCHLVHWSPEHFFLDVSVFLALGVAFEQRIGHRYWQILFAAGLLISMTLLIFQSGIETYRGISGLINAQIILGTGLYIFDKHSGKITKRLYLSVFCLHLIKTGYEVFFQDSIFSTESLGDLGLFTPLAHVTGVFVALGLLFLRRLEVSASYSNLRIFIQQR